MPSELSFKDLVLSDDPDARKLQCAYLRGELAMTWMLFTALLLLDVAGGVKLLFAPSYEVAALLAGLNGAGIAASLRRHGRRTTAGSNAKKLRAGDRVDADRQRPPKKP